MYRQIPDETLAKTCGQPAEQGSAIGGAVLGRRKVAFQRRQEVVSLLGELGNGLQLDPLRGLVPETLEPQRNVFEKIVVSQLCKASEYAGHLYG